jgi:hypothetical protein
MVVTTEMIMLSSGHLMKITGIKKGYLHYLVTKKIVTPICGGEGTGDHRRFGPITAIAISAGLHWRDCGATSDRTESVMTFLDRMGFGKLHTAIEKGESFPAPGSMIKALYVPGLMMTQEELENQTKDEQTKALIRRLDIKSIFQSTLRKIEEMKSNTLNS